MNLKENVLRFTVNCNYGGNYMRLGRTQTGMSSYRSPYMSFHAFTWNRPKSQLRPARHRVGSELLSYGFLLTLQWDDFNRGHLRTLIPLFCYRPNFLDLLARKRLLRLPMSVLCFLLWSKALLEWNVVSLVVPLLLYFTSDITKESFSSVTGDHHFLLFLSKIKTLLWITVNKTWK